MTVYHLFMEVVWHLVAAVLYLPAKLGWHAPFILAVLRREYHADESWRLLP